MKMKLFLFFGATLLLSFFNISAYAENADIPTIPNTGQKEENFIPKNWKMLKKVQGDMNKDNLTDTALVIENNDGNRILLLLFGKNKSFKLSVSSANTVLCRQCGGVLGDPFMDIKIDKGVLIIDHYGGSRDRWGFTHRFRFQNNNWYLIGEDKFSGDNLTLESKTYSINYLTGDVIIEKSLEEKLIKRKTSKIKIKKLIKLSDFDINHLSEQDISEEIKI